MHGQHATTTIEIPPSLPQQEIWDLEDQLKLIDEVEVDLREPKDLTSTTLLILHIMINTAEIVAASAGGAKAIYDVAKILYGFLHKSDKKQRDEEVKKKITIVKKGKRIEIANLSLEEIEHILHGHDDFSR